MKVRFLILALLILSSSFIFAQTLTVSGIVNDYDIGEPLIGVNVTYGSGMGTVTDINGEFILKLEPGTYTLSVSYVGFTTQTKEITVADKNIYLTFNLKTITLDEVEVVGDFARTRETPVAFTNISRAQIEEQLASQDIPMILNATPGVYATASGGGDGDARINIRGFNQRNVAVMLDGIPVNDMENGWVYWSNWFGLDAVLRGTQVQRGLGMSKLAIPSIGGTINLTTKGISDKKNISIKQEVGSAGYLRTSLGVTTGRMKNGWGITLAGSYKHGNGWVDQTWTEGWFYYLKVDKEIGNHVISFSAMGAPQKHGQRSYKKRMSAFDTQYALDNGMTEDYIENLDTNGLAVNMGLRYNPNWGYLSRAYITDTDTIYPKSEPLSTANNYYHKPMFSLRDFWNVNKKLYISNILYLSIGSGGGRSISPSPQVDTATGQQNIQQRYNENMNIPFGLNTNKVSGTILRNAVNNHFWLGWLGTFEYEINSSFTLSGGIDLRTYKGEHYREVDDLLGGNYYLDDGNKNESDQTKKYVGDKIGYYNDALVNWGGLFAQLKYQKGNLTTFLNLTSSLSAYKRIDYFIGKTLQVGDTTLKITYDKPVTYNGVTYDYQSEGLKTNESIWETIPGFTIKGGVNYNINEYMNVFANAGYMSKAQRFNNVFDYENQLYLEIKNEQIKSVELGFSIVKPRYTLNINTYYTIWENKPSDKRITYRDSINTDILYTVNINNMNARHMGAELEFGFRVTDNLLFESIFSLGDWKWTSKDTALIFNDNGQQVGKKPFDARGLYVGDAAQFQTRQSLRWQATRKLYFSGSFTYFGKHYSEFNPLDLDPEENPWAFDEDGNPIQSWKAPNYFIVDLNSGYSWRIQNFNFQLRASVLNLLDQVFVTDAQNNDSYLAKATNGFDANSASVFMGMGRRFNLSLRINF